MPVLKRSVFNRKFLGKYVSNNQITKREMKCKKLHKKLIFFLEGDLPGQEMEEIRQHIDKCHDCAAFAEDMGKTLSALQIEKAPAVNPFFFTRLKTRFENQDGIPAPTIRNPFFAKVLQPALFSLLLLAGIYTGIKIGQPAQNQLAADSYSSEQIIPFLNEMEAEPIEAFLME